MHDSTAETECNEIFTYVEQMPQFPGGETEMLNFIEDNIQFPKEALERNVQGVIYIRFAITPPFEVDRSVNRTESPSHTVVLVKEANG